MARSGSRPPRLSVDADDSRDRPCEPSHQIPLGARSLGRLRAKAGRTGRGRVKELAYDGDEGRRLLAMWIVSTALEPDEADTLERLDERPSVRDRNDPVANAPEDGDRRELRDLVRVVEERLALSTPVDDVPDGPRECSRGTGLGVHRRELSDLFSREGRVPEKREVRPYSHERLPEGFDDEGRRRETKRCTDLPPQASRCHEDEPSDSLGALAQEHLRDPTAERVPHDVHLSDTERIQPVCEDACVPDELVAGVGPLGQAMARQIRHEDAPISREFGCDVLPRSVRIVESVQHDHRRRAVRISELRPVKADAVDRRMSVGRSTAHAVMLAPPVPRLSRVDASRGTGYVSVSGATWGVAGSAKWNTLPSPGWLSTHTRPACASTMRSAM